MDKLKFINLVREQVTGLELPIPLSVLIAQAALESGWGESGLTLYGNALFGIKAGKTWVGKIYNARTKEVYNGTVFDVTASFRAYDSWRESIVDYINFIISNKRYEDVLAESDPYSACSELQYAGYATDPNYAEKLINIIASYELTKYDMDYVDTNMKAPDISKYLLVTEKVRIIIEQLEYLEGTRNVSYGSKDVERVNRCMSLLNDIYGVISNET